MSSKIKSRLHNQVVNHLNLANEDYLAARLLLIQGMLPQGAMFASTSVEKYIKAVLATKGVKVNSHLETKLLNTLRREFHEIYINLDIDTDFVKFLSKCYHLRYALVDSPSFSIVINQYRTLIALDTLIKNVDSCFYSQRNDQLATQYKTPYSYLLAERDSRLMELNVALGGISLQSILNMNNKVYELKIGKQCSGFMATYETIGVNITDSFCKKPNLPDIDVEDNSKLEFQLTRG